MANEKLIQDMKDHIASGVGKYEGYSLTDEECKQVIQALEQISHLTDRPCSVCEFHKEDGCSKWECVFEGSESEWR